MATIQHIPGEPDGLIQNCIVCGYEICNYTNAMVAPGGGPVPFWTAYQPIYCQGVNPTVTSLLEPENGDFKKCSP